MNVEAFADWWTSYAGGPELLFVIRAVTASIVMIATVLHIWEVISPSDGDKRGDKHKGQWFLYQFCRVLTAVGASTVTLYLILSLTVEAGRGGAPWRLLFINTGLSIFWFGTSGALFMRRVWNMQRSARRVIASLRGESPADV